MELRSGGPKMQIFDSLLRRKPALEVANVLAVEHGATLLSQNIGSGLAPLHVAVTLHAQTDDVVNRGHGPSRRTPAFGLASARPYSPKAFLLGWWRPCVLAPVDGQERAPAKVRLRPERRSCKVECSAVNHQAPRRVEARRIQGFNVAKCSQRRPTRYGTWPGRPSV
jgi:hypothetical protein